MRVQAVWRHALSFIQLAKGNAQIVNLGCGFDTLFWRLAVCHLSSLQQLLTYAQEQGLAMERFVEVDFSAVVERKKNVIRKNQQLVAQTGGTCAPYAPRAQLNTGVAERYHLVTADLRDLEQVSRALQGAGIDFK